MLAEWGYRLGRADDTLLPMVVCQLFLLNRSPHLEDLNTDLFDRVRRDRLLGGARLNTLHALQRAVAALGFCDPPRPDTGRHSARATGGAPSLAAVGRPVARHLDADAARPRQLSASNLLKVGRWLAAEHPEAADPAAWTRQTCAAWVAALDRMSVGDYVQRTAGLDDRLGTPLAASSKARPARGAADVLPRLPGMGMAAPPLRPAARAGHPTQHHRAARPEPPGDRRRDLGEAAVGRAEPRPRPTCRRPRSGHFYPIELVRAITLTWLFSGQRSDEIARLRVGCIRWQHDGAPIAGDSQQVLARDAVCLLDVPTHKTGTAFTKPVDPILGQAIDAWQAVRPTQPPVASTAAPANESTCCSPFRARRVSTAYINNTIIPMLCRKAGVPAADVRGNITSHRARSTIASQLYNAKEPMTLFELQAWLGHRSPQSTQYYAKISPNTLTRAYTDAGYFARNVRTIEVLVDRDAVTSGAAADGDSPGSTTTSATATAPTPSSNSAHTGWPAPAATSTLPRNPATASCWKPRTTCSGCSPPSRSPTTNAPPSTTARPPSTSSCNG